jgi:hypothetical protein
MRVIAAVVAVLGLVAVASAQDFKLPSSAGKVYFKNLKDGSSVPSKFKVEFGLDGLKVRPAGEDVNDRASGHHHLIVDGGPIDIGKPVPADEKNLHYGKGQTETEITLAPGTHKLTLQFADGAHRSYGPTWASTVTVNVK